MTPEPISIDGREGTVLYLDDTFTPVSPDTASLARVLFDDGGSAFYRVTAARTLGGPGSGNFGHAGRPGAVGGSGKGGGLPRTKVDNLLATIRQADGGFSYNVITGTQPTTGFMVSLNKEREQILDVRAVNVVSLAHYVRANRDLLGLRGKYLGAWHNPETGEVYLDVATRVHTAAEAETRGRAARQLAYYDLVRQQSVDIEEVPRGAEGFAESGGVGGWGADRGRPDRVVEAVDGPGSDAGRAGGGAADLRGAGGAGSGNFGHAGRPGEVGGSSTGMAGDRGGGGGVSPRPKTWPSPNGVVQSEADRYAAAHGLPPVDHGLALTVDEARARSIADAYDALPVDDRHNPEVKRAYAALATEVEAQYAYAVSNGMIFEPWTKDGQPYANAKEMADDVRENRHLAFFTGGEDHPFTGSSTLDASGLTINDKFRAIHDYYGHAAAGLGFGPRGEENAWAVHSQMFSETARRAMTSETRGQNSWVNFGRQNYQPDGAYKNIPPADRPFAPQKVALLPEQYSQFKALGGPGSGNFHHEGGVGGPGNPGGSQTNRTDDPVSDPRLASEAEAGIAAVEALLPQAIESADYSTGAPQSWEDLSSASQDDVYQAWHNQEVDSLELDTSDIWHDVRNDQIDEIRADDAFEEGVYEQVVADLAEQGVTLGAKDFDTEPGGPYGKTNPDLKVDGLVHADGTPYSKPEQDQVQRAWASAYEERFGPELERRMSDQEEHIFSLEAQRQDEVVSDSWGNMTDADKFSMAQSFNSIMKQAELPPGAPRTWKTGVDGELDSEDYNRTHAIGNRLTELRTEQIIGERNASAHYTIVEHPWTNVDRKGINYDVVDASGATMTTRTTRASAEEGIAQMRQEIPDVAQLAKETWGEWKNSSSSQMGNALQLAAARELGGVHRFTDDEVKRIDSDIGRQGMAHLQAYARAQWETSQYVMSKAGEPTVDVYRALMLPGAEVNAASQSFVSRVGEPLRVTINSNERTHVIKMVDPSGRSVQVYNFSTKDYPTEAAALAHLRDKQLNELTKLPELPLLRAGAQSTTGTLSVANSWQGVGKLPPNPTRVVMRVTVPRTSVLSLPVFGDNIQEEHEVVLAGTKDKWSWDAWKGTAPSFGDQPISNLRANMMRTAGRGLVLDLKDAPGQPHWLRGMQDPVIARWRARHLKTLGGPGSGNFGHAGGEGGPGNPGGSTVNGRAFTSEEGYAWHETGEVADWAHALPEWAHDAADGYVGFGYKDVNGALRGTFHPTKTLYLSDATPEVLAQIREVMPRLGPATFTDPKTGDVWTRDSSSWTRVIPDQERYTRAFASAATINRAIDEHGYVLPEPIQVSRYAYFPGTPVSDLERAVGTVREEQGFTSTMLGSAGGRLDFGPAASRVESVYDRYGKVDVQETGTAVRFDIHLPKDTRVLAIEALRRTGKYNEVLDKKDSRGESEVLLGSGARFKVRSVADGGLSKYGGQSVPVTHVTLDYIGGGSSERR